MNSSKLLRVGVPALGLCVFAFAQTGCRSKVLDDRASVPPAEREAAPKKVEPAAKTESFDAFEKDTAVAAKNNKVSGSDFKYPKFEDTENKPIYSAPKGSSKTVSGGSSVYIVRRGDTLGKIAARHRIKVADLANANNLKLNSIIRVNQKLQIPGGKTVAPAKKSSKTSTVKNDSSAARSGLYTVRRGDSIYIIAKRLKVKRADLMAANNLTPQSVLRPGQTLKLPGAKVVNEESVVVDNAPATTVAPAAETAPAAAPAKKKSAEENSDDELLRNLENDASASSATQNDAAENVGAAAKAAAPAGGTPTEVAQEIHIDEYCKKHNINKAEMLKLNSNLNENSVLKPNTIFIIP